MSHYLILGIFVLTGVLSLMAALCNWEWFFTARNTQWVVRNVGRQQARWFYGVLGLILMATACFFYTQTPASV